MTIPLFHVDAFADRPFAGNPAAVCLLAAWKEDRWLQAVAREMNLSETAFLVKQPDHFDLRWFTPKVEVDLCGHATLASAHVLWQQGQATGAEISFSTRSGILTARNQQGEIELNFPLEPDEAAPSPANLVAALNISPAYVGKTAIGASASAGTVPAPVMIGKSLKQMWPTTWPARSATSDTRT